MVPGRCLEEKWNMVAGMGYAAIELRPTGGLTFEKRLPELERASAYGVVMRTACPDMPTHFIGAFKPEHRRDAIENIKSQLTTMVTVSGEGAGLVIPAAYGMYSLSLPPFDAPPRTPEQDRKVLLGALTEIAEHAETEGARVFLEPLNRYGDHMLNRLDQAVELVDKVGSSALAVTLDTFHANIEEDDTAAAIARVGKHIGHVQLGENHRFHPGTGQLQWQPVLRALRGIGYAGYMVLECKLRGEPEEALRESAKFMHAQWTQAVEC